MTQEDKQLLVKDLSARLPYKVIIKSVGENKILGLWDLKDIDNLPLPYLRPMSTMTEEEKEGYCNLQAKFLCSNQYLVTDAYELFDWLNKNHFDYRGLIPKDLAIEVTKENNPYKD